jgi:death-on-curing protein
VSDKPWEKYCTPARVFELHDKALQAHGGRAGVTEPNGPDATLGAAWNAIGFGPIQGEEYALILAAYVLYYFATKQVFSDGNKRIAWLAMCEVLAAVDLEVGVTNLEGSDMVLAVAEKRASVEQVYSWIADNVRELTKPVDQQPAAVKPADAVVDAGQSPLPA